MKSALICMLQLHKNSGSARTALENIHYFKSKGYEFHVAAMTMDKESLRAEGAIPHKMLPWFKSTGITRSLVQLSGAQVKSRINAGRDGGAWGYSRSGCTDFA